MVSWHVIFRNVWKLTRITPRSCWFLKIRHGAGVSVMCLTRAQYSLCFLLHPIFHSELLGIVHGFHCNGQHSMLFIMLQGFVSYPFYNSWLCACLNHDSHCLVHILFLDVLLLWNLTLVSYYSMGCGNMIHNIRHWNVLTAVHVQPQCSHFFVSGVNV